MVSTKTPSDKPGQRSSRAGSRLRPIVVALAMLLGGTTLSVATSSRADDPLAAYRERFQQGLERYRAGDVQGAIQYWEPIRRELGDERGYRLLFNLGKAYEAIGDATRAAERYEAFLAFADKAATQGALEPNVAENVAEARTRMQELNRTRGRIRVLPSERPGLVQIDLGDPRLGAFRAFVAPGQHTVTVDRATPSERVLELVIEAGEEVVVDPTRPPPPAASASASPPTAVPPTAFALTPRVAPPASSSHRERPFSPYVLVAASGVTALSVAVPWLVWRRARRLADRYDDPATSSQDRRELYDDYANAKTTYAWSWAVPGILAGTTGALTLWYFEGTHDAVTIETGPRGDGAWMGMRGSF